MTITILITIVTLILAISLAAERLTEIVKGLIPFLNNENPDPRKEGWRRVCIQLLAVASGITTAILSRPIIDNGPVALFCTTSGGTACGPDQNWDSYSAVLALGFLASGGSALWNSILEYLLKVKDIKEVEVERKKADLVGGTRMDDFVVAMTVTINCIKEVGRDEPILPDDILFDHGIDDELIDSLIRTIATSKTIGLRSLNPKYKIDQNIFDISSESTTNEVALIVFDNAVLDASAQTRRTKRRRPL